MNVVAFIEAKIAYKIAKQLPHFTNLNYKLTTTFYKTSKNQISLEARPGVNKKDENIHRNLDS